GVRLDVRTQQRHANLRHRGKGRRQRCLPLWKPSVDALRAWLAVRGHVRVPELFINTHDEHLTRSGVEYLLRKHTQTARQRCPSLTTKRVFPHLLRHTCALTVLG